MTAKSTILVSLMVCITFLTSGCNEPPRETRTPTSKIVSGKISQPDFQKKPEKKIEKKQGEEKADLKKEGDPGDKKILASLGKNENSKHYDAKGKIDPFKPLIQEKPEAPKPVVDKTPKRIKTPLEKIELSQIRLVAVIVMKKKRIAMVEEASGKGYEVGIGTFIGKREGKVTQIKDSSIVITETTRDYKGKYKKNIQEIKLHKLDNEE